MKKLLDSAFDLPLRLLEQFYKYEPDQTITYYSKELNSDRRSILKTVHVLQKDILLNNWQDMITIEITDKNLSTTIGPLFSIEKFYSYYMSKSFGVMLAIQLFEHPTDSIEKTADALYVSKATFYRRLEPLKQVLADFNLTLDFVSSENNLVGSEKQIRYFFYTLFWEIDRNFSFFDTSLSDSQKNKLHTVLTDSNLSISFILMIELQIEIALYRLKKGDVMDSFPQYKLPELYMTYSNFRKLLTPFFNTNSANPSILDIELSALYFSMTTSSLYLQRTSDSLLVSHNYWSPPVTTIVHQWIFYFIDFFNLSLTHDEYFYLTVNLYILHLKQKILIGGSLYLGFTSLADVLYEDNRYVNSQTNLFFDFINQQEPQFHVDKFHIFSYSLLLRRIMFRSLPVLNVLVCSKVGIENQLWLEERISHISTVPVKFQLKWSNDCDLIISDFELPPNYIPENQEAYFLWSGFSNFSEWIQLVKRLEKIYFEKI